VKKLTQLLWSSRKSAGREARGKRQPVGGVDPVSRWWWGNTCIRYQVLEDTQDSHHFSSGEDTQISSICIQCISNSCLSIYTVSPVTVIKNAFGATS